MGWAKHAYIEALHYEATLMSDSWLKLSTADKVWLLKRQADTVKYHLERLQDTRDTEQVSVSKELEACSAARSWNVLKLGADIQED